MFVILGLARANGVTLRRPLIGMSVRIDGSVAARADDRLDGPGDRTRRGRLLSTQSEALSL